MRNDRQRRRQKKARREAVRAKARTGESQSDPSLTEIIRRALAKRHPGYLLNLASMMINLADAQDLDAFLAGLIQAGNRETAALLAVMVELLVDDTSQRLRCRQVVAERDDCLPKWIAALAGADAHRAVRRSRELGDIDEVLVGVRIDRKHELTVAVAIDHIEFSGIADVAVWAAPIDRVLNQLASNSDTQVADMSLADARVWIADALTQPRLSADTEGSPLYRPLVRWLVERLPVGGKDRLPVVQWREMTEICDAFFATDAAAPFTELGHRQLLQDLFETGSGDPLRWSVARVEQALHNPYCDDGYIPLEVALDMPDVLRAFIPYAHAQSEIRDELTSQAVGAIDRLRSRYKREALKQAMYDGLEDAV